MFVKPYALVLVPWLAWTLGWRPFVPFCLVLSGGLMLPVASYGWNGNLTLLHEWYRTVTDTTGPNLLAFENISFASMWAKWMEPGPAAASLALGSAVVAVAAGIAVMWRRRHVAEPNYLEGRVLLRVGAAAVAAGLGLRAYHRAARLCVPRGSVARIVASLGARSASDGLLPHELHHFRPAPAAALHPSHAAGCRKRWRRADCRLPYPLAVAVARVSAGGSLYTHFPDMSARLRLFAFLAIILLAIVVYNTRVRHEMIDFITWRQAAVRALDAEPLYRPEDGHYQFKYFPMFAVMMAPFGVLDQDTGKVLWFAISVGLLAALLRWSVAALPERRLSQRILVFFAIVLMAKFYAHELLLGQTNLLLGVLLVRRCSPSRSIGGSLPVGSWAWPSSSNRTRSFWFPGCSSLRVGQPPPWPLASVTIGLLLPAAVYGWSGNLDLLREWLRTVTDSTTPNLLGTTTCRLPRCGPSGWAQVLWRPGLAWLTVIGTLVLVIVAWRRRRAVSAPEYLECALLMLLVPLISPQGWDYVLLLATPAVVCLVDRWRELTRLLAVGTGGRARADVSDDVRPHGPRRCTASSWRCRWSAYAHWPSPPAWSTCGGVDSRDNLTRGLSNGVLWVGRIGSAPLDLAAQPPPNGACE